MKLKHNAIKTIILSALAVVALGAMLIIPLGVSATAELKEQPAIRTEYILGESVTVPEGVLIVGGGEYPAQAIVHTPDGNALSNSEITLTEVGEYAVQYKAKVNGWWYSDYVYFNVNRSPMTLDGGPSSTYEYDEETGRIHLSLAQLDTFNFNHVIDLNGKTKDDAILSLYVTSDETNIRDFEEIIIVLTDAYDPTNKVYVRLMGDSCNTTHPDDFTSDDPDNMYRYSRYQSYVSANLDGGKTWTFLQDNGSSKASIRRVQQHGLPLWFSFCNEANLRAGCGEMEQEDDVFVLSFDSSTNQLHHLSAKYSNYNSLIVDLDDEDYFEGWQGFTNNEVYISVYAQDVHTSANFTIKTIDYEGALNADVVDTTPPTITLDCSPYTKDTAPDAIVGRSYAVFPATVSDINIYNDDIAIEVYLNYGTENAVMIDLTDGAFTPSVAGDYAIVYSKTDAFGNVGREVVNVKAINDAEEIEIKVADLSATAGIDHAIPAPEAEKYDPRTGKLNLVITAERNEISEVLYEGLLEEYQPVEYRFMMAGAWTVNYTVSDHSRSVTKTVTCSVDKGTSIIYDKFDELDIDKTLIANNTYNLPLVYVVTFTETEAVYTRAEIKVKGESGEKLLASNKLSVTEDMGSRVVITYFDPSNPSCEIYGTRSIANIGSEGKYQLDKLFVATNATVSATDTSIDFTADQNAVIEMLTKQNAESLSIEFQLDSVGTAFKSFSILLTDSVDANVQLRITIEQHQTPVTSSWLPTSYSMMYLNGDKTNTLNLQSTIVGSTRGYNVSFANKTCNVSCTDIADSKNGLTAATCVDGSIFEGFPSGMVYITFEMEAVGESPAFMLYSINKQSMSDFSDDFQSPSIFLGDGAYASTYPINGTVATVPAQGIDVINGFCNAQITVKHIDGNFIYTTDGREINKLDASQSYEFISDQYGEYVIYYYSTDVSGNTNSNVYYSFYVEDLEKPTLEIVGNKVEVAWVGDKYVMPELDTKDNVTKDMRPYVVITTPSRTKTAVGEEGYVFESAGSYKVVIMVFDEEGNKAEVSYYVEVVE